MHEVVSKQPCKQSLTWNAFTGGREEACQQLGPGQIEPRQGCLQLWPRLCYRCWCWQVGRDLPKQLPLLRRGRHACSIRHELRNRVVRRKLTTPAAGDAVVVCGQACLQGQSVFTTGSTNADECYPAVDSESHCKTSFCWMQDCSQHEKPLCAPLRHLSLA